MEKQEFVIDRAKWRCGGDGPCAHGLGITSLFNSHEFSDALGQVCLQLGCAVEDVKGRSVVEESPNNTPLTNKLKNTPVMSQYGYLLGFGKDLVLINDHEGLSDAAREEQLLKRFTDSGLKLSFTGEYEDRIVDALVVT